MQTEMTQDALCSFIPGKAARITTLLRQDRRMALKQALLTFYRSKAYRLLEQEKTKLWHESPAQIYAEYLKPFPCTRQTYQNGPGHSKLAPYTALLQEWRAKGMTLQQMTAELGRFGCTTTIQNLSVFLRRNSSVIPSRPNPCPPPAKA